MRPENQGKGFGRMLLSHVERRAVAHGRVEARLLTNAAFAGNVMLYTQRRLRDSQGRAVHGRNDRLHEEAARAIATLKAIKPRAEASGLHLDRALPTRELDRSAPRATARLTPPI